MNITNFKMIRRAPAIPCIAVLLAFAPVPARAEPEVSKEFKVKAALLLNFAQYTQWPANAFAADGAPVEIGILGADPFGTALDEMARSQTVRGRAIVIRRSQNAEVLKSCHVVFIASSEAQRLDADLAALKDSAALTISGIRRFAVSGGMFNFYLNKEGRVRFEINSDAAQKKGFKISSQLQQLSAPPDSDAKWEK